MGIQNKVLNQQAINDVELATNGGQCKTALIKY